MILDYNLINFSLCVKDDKKNTLLHLMVLNNDCDTLLSFVNHLKTACYEKKYIRQILDAQNYNGDTPLHIAVKNNNQMIAEKLYNCGASTNIPNKDDFAVQVKRIDDLLKLVGALEKRIVELEEKNSAQAAKIEQVEKAEIPISQLTAKEKINFSFAIKIKSL